MTTKTYASVLWIFGLFLDSINQVLVAMRYLEEATRYFEEIDCKDVEYYQCIIKLAEKYISEYNKNGNMKYIERAILLGNTLFMNKDDYSSNKDMKHVATQINKQLNKFRGIKK